MPEFFQIEMLPAGYGDALWIEYGTRRKINRILIDGGLGATYDTLRDRLLSLKEGDRHLELVVCTHIDLDHISGLISLFRKPPPGLKIGDIWFNGWPQIKDQPGVLGGGAPDSTTIKSGNGESVGVLGPKQGEVLEDLIHFHGLQRNSAFGGKAVAVPQRGKLPTCTLPGGMKITVLGPPRERLTALAAKWKDVVSTPGSSSGAGRVSGERIGILGGPDVPALARDDQFREDTAVANGSSIVLLLEWAEKRVLLTGDGMPSDVLAGLKKWNFGSGLSHARLDAFKLSHHGGKSNTSSDLLRHVHTDHYLISTNGVKFEHPDQETVARVLVHGPQSGTRHLHFNYRTKYNEIWDKSSLRARYRYESHYPKSGSDGMKVVLL